MKDKKGFILYADYLNTVDKLTENEAGILFRTILQYVNDQDPKPTDRIVEITFEPIRQQLKRDLESWNKFKQKQSDNGKLGGRPKNPDLVLESQINPKNPSLFLESQKSLNVNVNDNVTVNVNDNVNENKGKLKIFTPPSYQEFEKYGLQKKSNVCLVALKLKYESWAAADWHDGHGKKINNWKAKLCNTLGHLKENQNNVTGGVFPIIDYNKVKTVIR